MWVAKMMMLILWTDFHDRRAILDLIRHVWVFQVKKIPICIRKGREDGKILVVVAAMRMKVTQYLSMIEIRSIQG